MDVVYYRSEAYSISYTFPPLKDFHTGRAKMGTTCPYLDPLATPLSLKGSTDFDASFVEV